ncbi:bifunctional proline dehydrogenase/L-glutamate gamma-semialdehyde dehydrogenase [Tessaracoccus sp. SD287]|uniref:bifunctional proline dehydrogenase/L-glutamate gamma-semialdehyde dehydrogenase n=1 Tax=Tessaracoccus sp. SD287 TaxID=2782008 RepID=UPI001A95DBE4|nr:bifunctional proline dehydrogenase/L-glutamate gamma-semialdehyde dehydrogenase [Tessaracoccus sp. SD287]MBO1030800.1 bifunctional proline dehydrogenase/L-glutamate gamma-semialdehyde dehydrogenase [Tessaracoccus sp. SD287]
MDAADLVREWLDDARGVPVGGGPQQLARLLRDPAGLDFAVGFVDGVVRPEDPHVAAATLRALAGDVPRSIPPHLRAGLRLAAFGSGIAPGVVTPIVGRALRSLVGHLVVDASDRALGRNLARLRRPGTRLNINLLGEAVLGRAEANRRLADLIALVGRDDVDYVSVKVSAVIGPHSPWAFDQTVAQTISRLVPLYRAAQSTGTFLNLDMEEYRDLALTMAVFTGLLDAPEFAAMDAGIVLQAYLPDALAAMQSLQRWAAARRARGGAAVKVRLVKGANLPMESVEAELRGWPPATWPTKQQTDTNYKRVLDWALRPERADAIRLGVAGHNLFDIAWAWQLAEQRGVAEAVDVEMLLGMAPAQAEAVRRTVGSLVLYTPVVHPAHFDVAIAYLIRRLEEGAAPQNFMSALFDLADDPAMFDREAARFHASLEALDEAVPRPRRTQDRRVEHAGTLAPPVPGAFVNTADTDPALPANLAWAAELLDRVAPGGEVAPLDWPRVSDADALEQVLATATAAAPGWQQRGAAGRARVLRAAATELQRRRADLLVVMAGECGKTIAEADPEVSEAVDFAAYYADRAEDLERIDGAVQRPPHLVVVTPPWNFPVAIPAGSTLAALAAGAAVVLKPAPQAERCGLAVAEALWAAGVPRQVLQVALTDEGEVGRALVTDPRVDRVILTGAYETAEMFAGWRPEVGLLAETSGKNAIIVTPSADIDLAVRDVVASAFGHAGQKCSAASLVILVGAVGRSRRFRSQLVDAVESLRVGWPEDPGTQMGPLIGPAQGKLLDALTRLEPGQQWWVEPRRLDRSGRLWSPGVRGGVRPGDQFHLVEYFGPVLGVMVADDLDQAIAWQNQPQYGLTAGLHSLDRDEVRRWVDQVQAGNLYVNRGITGAIVGRQPFGGWKRSAVGAGAKAGGPNYLIALSDWTSAPAADGPAADGPAGSDEHLSPEAGALLAAARTAGLGVGDLSFLERSLHSDALARAEFTGWHDPSGLLAETNLLRYRPVQTLVRVEADARVVDLLRVVGAALSVGARPEISCATDPGSGVVTALAGLGLVVRVGDGDWLDRLTAPRIRLLGTGRDALARALGARRDVALHAQPVTESGRLEPLAFVAEQAVSVTNHRFGVANQMGTAVGTAQHA